MAQANYEIRRKCPICGAVFQIRTIDSVYCSKQCSGIAYKRKKDREVREAKYEELAKEIPDIRVYLSVQEAVAVYCVERDTLYREIRKGKIPSVNLGTKQLRLNRTDLEQRYQRRKKVRKAAKKPIPKKYSLEPEDCYTIGEISQKYRIHDSSVYAHIRKFPIPTRQIGNFVYAPKSEIDKLYKSIEL